MSAFDNCFFYRTTATETTYIIIYVDDTFIFSKSSENIDAVVASVGKHNEVTLDRDATSFLGLNEPPAQLGWHSDNTTAKTTPQTILALPIQKRHRALARPPISSDPQGI